MAKCGKLSFCCKSNDLDLSVLDLYKLTGEVLGQGAYASVQTCVNLLTDLEFAVKIIDKVPGHSRSRVFKEVETFHHCQGHPGIIQMLEFFEDEKRQVGLFVFTQTLFETTVLILVHFNIENLYICISVCYPITWLSYPV